MKIYLIRYEYDIVAITDDFESWLKENNDRRVADGDEPESEATFNIEEFDADFFKLTMPKKIKIPFSEEDLHELNAGETFDWNFDGVAVHLYKGDEDEES